jgi:hypothetical protein
MAAEIKGSLHQATLNGLARTGCTYKLPHTGWAPIYEPMIWWDLWIKSWPDMTQTSAWISASAFGGGFDEKR